jgi:hypothetical protein
MSDLNEAKKIKPEVLAAIAGVLAAYGSPAEQVPKAKKGFSPWRKAGILEIMLGRELKAELPYFNLKQE